MSPKAHGVRLPLSKVKLEKPSNTDSPLRARLSQPASSSQDMKPRSQNQKPLLRATTPGALPMQAREAGAEPELAIEAVLDAAAEVLKPHRAVQNEVSANPVFQKGPVLVSLFSRRHKVSPGSNK